MVVRGAVSVSTARVGSCGHTALLQGCNVVALRSLKTRVQLQHALSFTQNAIGQRVPTWTTYARPWCERRRALHVADGGGRCHTDSGDGLPDAPG